MIRTITDLLKKEIAESGLHWLDQVNGMIEAVKLNVQDGDNVIEKTLPVYRKPFQKNCKKSNDYNFCLPDTAYKSMIYLETENQQNIAHTTNYDEFSLPVTIVAWLNLRKINKDLESGSELLDELLAIIPNSLPATSPYNTIRVHLSDVNRDMSVVNKWTLDEAEEQMWIYPFDFFVIRLDILYRRTKNCSGTTTSDPALCNIYN